MLCEDCPYLGILKCGIDTDDITEYDEDSDWFQEYTRKNSIGALRNEIASARLHVGGYLDIDWYLVLTEENIWVFQIMINSSKDTTNLEGGTIYSLEYTGDSLVYDSKDIKVYFVGVEETYLGTELKFRAENNRSEDIEITVDTLIINGYDVTAYFYLDVASGLKKVESITILQSSLDDIGVSKIDKVTCNFKITEGLIDTVDTFSVTLN